jgi:hypothetical protein
MSEHWKQIRLPDNIIDKVEELLDDGGGADGRLFVLWR